MDNAYLVIIRQRAVERTHSKFPDTADPKTYVECKICGFRSPDLAGHPSRVHGISQDEYKTRYGSIKSEATREAMKGEKNPAFNHGGRLSPFSRKFLKYTDDTKFDEAIEQLHKKSNQTKTENNVDNTKIGYYLSRGMTQD